MDAKIDKLISLSIQIAKYVAHQENVSFEERAATMLQYHALAILEKEPRSKLTLLAQHLRASLSSTTQLVERLHKASLLNRESDEKDRRVIHLSLTKEGITKLKHMREVKRERMKKLFRGIDAHDIDEFIRIQEKLLKSLEIEKKQ